MKLKTTQNPEKSIKSAFDSVDLINKTIISEIDEDKKSLIDRNIKHLELMLTKEFFIEALSKEQKDQIESAISQGKSHIFN